MSVEFHHCEYCEESIYEENCFTRIIDGEEIKSNRYYETLLHKRTEKFINNYLLKKVKETNSVGYDIKEIDTEKIISEIPYELALDYKV